MIELLLKLEMSLWIEETRNNMDYLNKVLHDDFIEFGRSGKIYTKDDELNAGSTQMNTVFPFLNLKVKEIAENTYLITYTAVEKKNNKEVKSNRSSIWVTQNGELKLLHHQGTITK